MTIKSIARAADVLKCINEGDDRITDIARRLNLYKSTVHRLLQTLEELGFVIKDPGTRRYCIGYLFTSIALNPMVTHESLVMASLEEMEHLRDITGESVTLQIQAGMYRLFLEEVQSNQVIKHTIGKGIIHHLHTGSGGIVLLSQLPENELDIVLKSVVTHFKKDDGITNLEAFKKQVIQTGKQGYATSTNLRAGTASVSVPVKNYIRPAALTVFGPDNRFTNVDDVVPHIKKSADQISERLLTVINNGQNRHSKKRKSV